MSTPVAPSEGSTQTPAAAPAASTTTSSPSAVFGDNSAPEWIKSAGLEEAHKKGTPEGAAPAQPATQTPPVTATPSAAHTQPASTPSVQPVAPSFDAKTLAQAIREANQPAPAGPSDEEVAKQLGIVNFTPETYKAAFGVDATPEQVKAFNDYGQGIAKQAVTIANILFDRKFTELQSSLAPYTQVIQQQEANRIKGEFFKSNADLAGYEELVTQQYQLAKASGRKFATLEEAGKFVADQTRSVLKSLGITPAAPKPADGTPTSGKSAPQTRQMAPQTMGGKGSGAPSAAKPSSTVEAVWGSR